MRIKSFRIFSHTNKIHLFYRSVHIILRVLKKTIRTHVCVCECVWVCELIAMLVHVPVHITTTSNYVKWQGPLAMARRSVYSAMNLSPGMNLIKFCSIKWPASFHFELNGVRFTRSTKIAAYFRAEIDYCLGKQL